MAVAEWRHCLSPLAGKCTTRLVEAKSQHANSVVGVRIDELFAAKSRGEERRGEERKDIAPFRRFRNAVVVS
jgi:hypothetical protein